LHLELGTPGSLHEQSRRIDAADAHLASTARMNGALIRASEGRAHHRSAARVDGMQLCRLDVDRDPVLAAQAGIRFEPDVQRAIFDARAAVEDNEAIARATAPRSMWTSVQS
jgi:hypothetical protein